MFSFSFFIYWLSPSSLAWRVFIKFPTMIFMFFSSSSAMNICAAYEDYESDTFVWLCATTGYIYDRIIHMYRNIVVGVYSTTMSEFFNGENFRYINNTYLYIVILIEQDWMMIMLMWYRIMCSTLYSLLWSTALCVCAMLLYMLLFFFSNIRIPITYADRLVGYLVWLLLYVFVFRLNANNKKREEGKKPIQYNNSYSNSSTTSTSNRNRNRNSINGSTHSPSHVNTFMCYKLYDYIRVVLCADRNTHISSVAQIFQSSYNRFHIVLSLTSFVTIHTVILPSY